MSQKRGTANKCAALPSPLPAALTQGRRALFEQRRLVWTSCQANTLGRHASARPAVGAGEAQENAGVGRAAADGDADDGPAPGRWPGAARVPRRRVLVAGHLRAHATGGAPPSRVAQPAPRLHPSARRLDMSMAARVLHTQACAVRPARPANESRHVQRLQESRSCRLYIYIDRYAFPIPWEAGVRKWNLVPRIAPDERAHASQVDRQVVAW